MLIDDLRVHCREGWRDWFGEATPSRIDLAFTPSRARSSERAVAMVFSGGELRAVLKLAKTEQDDLRREGQVLRFLSDRHSALSDVIPHVLGEGCEEVRRQSSTEPPGRVLLLPLRPVGGRLWRPPAPELAISGRPFSRVERVLWRLDELLDQLNAFPSQPDVSPLGVDWRIGSDLLRLDAHARMWLQTYYHAEGQTVGLGRLSHGDLAPGNVRLSSSGVRAILDWELLDTGYEPWFDRLYPPLLAMSLALVRGLPLPATSWPLRWLAVLTDEPSQVPLRVRCLRVTAELASRSVLLRRRSVDQWAVLARYLQEMGELAEG